MAEQPSTLATAKLTGSGALGEVLSSAVRDRVTLVNDGIPIGSYSKGETSYYSLSCPFSLLKHQLFYYKYKLSIQ